MYTNAIFNVYLYKYDTFLSTSKGCVGLSVMMGPTNQFNK